MGLKINGLEDSKHAEVRKADSRSSPSWAWGTPSFPNLTPS